MINSLRESIAVIGSSCRFPGNVNNLEQYWEFLKAGKDAVGEIPRERWNWAFHYDENTDKNGKMHVKRGCFLDADIELFDAAFFEISPREAAILDPQQRILLELTYEALEDAVGDVRSLRGSQTGVYLGAFMQDNLLTQMGASAKSQMGTHTAVSSTMTMISNRMSYTFDLRGPSFTLDTACSSSLVAIHQACRGLLAGDCKMAVSGGINIMFRPEIMTMMSKGRFLSRDGRSKTFSAHADGYGRGEGGGLVVLKRLSKALRDGNQIHAVIRGSGINQDGNTDGITVPNEYAQVALANSVYQEAGVDVADITYLEAHGTGTPVGDPIEMRAMGNVVGSRRAAGEPPLVVGSVKAGIGHLEAAAGVAGFLKAVLVAKHGQIAPQAWLDSELNPAIDFEGMNLQVADRLQPLPNSVNGRACVAINSFGYGGTNAHAVVEAFNLGNADSSKRIQPGIVPAPKERGHVLFLSADSDEAIQDYAEKYARLIKLSDAAKTAQINATIAQKTQLSHRVAITAASKSGLLKQINKAIEGSRDSIYRGRAYGKAHQPVLVFSGMGPQWWGMGHQLYQSEPLFKSKLDQADNIFREIAGWSILEEMLKDEEASQITKTEIAQPANFMLQMGLFELFKSFGITPAAVVGHSVGEVSSAYVSGMLDLKQALHVSYHRSRTQGKTAGTGSMAATGVNLAQAHEIIAPYNGRVAIAGINSETATTLSGNSDDLDKIVAELEAAEKFARKLRVDVPYHSSGMEPILDELRESLVFLNPRPATIPVYSTVTGELADENSFGAQYWCDNVRKPVCFYQAIEHLLDEGNELFLEVGPHPVLTGYVREALSGRDGKGKCLSTLKRSDDENSKLRESICQLWVNGADVNHQAYIGVAPDHTIKLPAYPWQRKRHWLEQSCDREIRQGWPQAHPLLGRKLPDPYPNWHSELSKAVLDWLPDHQVGGDVVFPGAGYIEILLALLADQSSGETPKILRDVKFHRAMILGEDEDAIIRTTLTGENKISIFAGLATKCEEWFLHSEAKLGSGTYSSCTPPLEPANFTGFEEIAVESLYQKFNDLGLQYGPSFQTIKNLKTNQSKAVVELVVDDDKPFTLHPAILDGAFQAMLTLGESDSSTAYLPVHVNQVRVHGLVGKRTTAYINLVSKTDKSVTADIKFITENTVVVELNGIRCDAAQLNAGNEKQLLDQISYKPVWHEVDYSDSISTAQNVIVIGEQYPQGLKQSLLASGCGEVYEFHQLSQLIQHPSRVDCQLLVICVSSKSAEHACAQAGQTLVDLAALEEQVAGARIVFLTQSTQAGEIRRQTEGWRNGWVTGLRRNLTNELSRVDFRQVDYDDCVSAQVLCNELLSTHAPDEIALIADKRYALEIRRLNSNDYKELTAISSVDFNDNGENNFYLELPENRLVNALHFKENSRDYPANNQVEVRVDAVQIDRTDVAKIKRMPNAGMAENSNRKLTLGTECTGKIMRVGENITDYSAGDKVTIFTKNCCQRYITINVDEKSKPYSHIKPISSEYNEPLTTASIGIYATALSALRDSIRLHPGETLFIHGDTGDISSAMINVAKWLGAEIIVSADNDDKREYFYSLGVDHVIDNYSLDLREKVRALTSGEGANAVVNFADSDDAINASMDTLGRFGRFIELGNRNGLNDNVMPAMMLNDSITFSSLELDILIEHDNDYFIRLVDDVWKLFDDGKLPSLPQTIFGADKVADAFEYISEEKNFGKVVLDLSQTPKVSVIKTRSSTLAADKTILITGGLGGVGLIAANWCLDQGAQRLALLGRSSVDSPIIKETVAQLQARGARVDVYQCDVSDKTALANVLDQVEQSQTLGGVIHAAGVLDDKPVKEIDAESVEFVASPKILGASHLHELTKNKFSLDLFIVLSSVSAISGHSKQANYCLSNAYMDALMQHRQTLGLPGNSINLGPVADAGMAVNNRQLQKYLELMGLNFIDSDVLKNALTRVVNWNLPQLIMVDIDWPVWGGAEPRAAGCYRFEKIMIEEGSKEDNSEITASLLKLPRAEQIEVVSYVLAENIAEILQMDSDDVDVELPLDSFGIDSLTAVEVQSRINRTFNIEISILSMLAGKTLRDISAEIVDLVKPDRGIEVSDESEPESESNPAESRKMAA